MDSDEGVSLPWIHKHLMVPWNDMRKGDCCGRFEAISAGYYCKSCDFFAHKKCGDEASESIQHPSHSIHPLWLQSIPHKNVCNLCGSKFVDIYYRCEICNFNVDLHCAKYPPPEVIDVSVTHPHKLTLFKKRITFDCDAKCGKRGDYEFAYKCHECDDISFHVDCVWNQLEVEHPLEVNHSYHSVHALKLLTGQPPEYSDGKCRLCGKKVDKVFYHCSSCNFTLDMCCVLNPPQQSLLDLRAHDHQLSLVPRLDSFTCNACGLKGDRSPYVCFQCDFKIHQDCLGLPRIINITRHDHRISRTSVLGVVGSVCGVCRKKVDWTYGGYSCQRCPGYVVHSKCATRQDVWNEKELEGVPEEIEDIEPYIVIDENTIQHFSHKEHYLRLNVNGVLYEVSKRCNACIHPIGLQSFYDCIDCDFVLHQNCAAHPKNRWHMLHSEQLTLVTNEVVMIDGDLLSLCYGEEEGSGKYWCDICEKETNPETWFYKAHSAIFHKECVVGDFSGLMPRTTIEYLDRSFEVVLNDGTTRPFCKGCESRCIYPIILKLLGNSDTYFCSDKCIC
ncbi:hypothetical protein AALP_AA6G033700 [Arabis alpina]|uniref:Phorbol-ester/DAG-type domain-containing protein n=1 Tax=Arabis alpina TaxID=50452 RepID=A0A087GLV0_ARAAL|nr:hypothetical protein AALP_AA6G033700 [Arabis alpina]